MTPEELIKKKAFIAMQFQDVRSLINIIEMKISDMPTDEQQAVIQDMKEYLMAITTTPLYPNGETNY